MAVKMTREPPMIDPTSGRPDLGDGDWEDDYRDGVLFRFWIRMVSYPGGSPAKVAKALQTAVTPSDYRKALTELAQREGVNLP